MEPTTKRTDAFALVCLVIGGFVLPIIGWGVGVWLVWRSLRWTVREKWLGTMLWPMFLLAPGAIFTLTHDWRSPIPVVLVYASGALCVVIAIRLTYRLVRTP